LKSTVAVSVLLLIALGALLYLVYALMSTAIAWTTIKLDDIRYGYPRTFQMNGVLSARTTGVQRAHFLVRNLQGRVWITIVPDDTAGRELVIEGPQLLGKDRNLAPPTLALQDVNRDGYADLGLHVAGKTFLYHQDPHQQSFVLSGDLKQAQ
jgi:hypothetical protein